MTEDELIATLFAPLAGPGGLGLKDDAAVLSPGPDEDVVTTVDALVAGVHFFPDDPPEAIAAKVLGVNLSDLAAKAAAPAGFLLALALPAGSTEAWLEVFARGLGVAAARHGCPLLGGDTVRTPGPLTLSVTVFGTVPRGRMLPRTGLRPGDVLYVSGTIGDAALGLALRTETMPGLSAALNAGLSVEAQAVLSDRYLYPRPRLALRPALRAHASAGMDVSDGLVGDLRKMLAASGAGGVIRLGAVPLSDAARNAVACDPRAWAEALTGGDDYELLVGVPPDATAAFEADAAQAGVAVTAIGTVGDLVDGIALLDAAGQPARFVRGSFQHF
ncbi:thiamine-phosphate kinase [Lichenihabitans sp. Uapishka_5]|uniref:thiamine-phosphate kinase n=1 Tax=Lichenihabitans sp. Uapishka_5 TaxID=3037302 RepID=UPI0029E803D9|nr:thiamine-phosphate kinase [Lichenihabitans sp. Uapishka_5]MDX7950751.1 thiamine-phosphate kinase [Lichenihabitans sp. Uapishka_5]